VNPDIDGFELDGNAAGGTKNDWDSLGGPLAFTGFRSDPTDGTDLGFGSGQTKDTRDISQWTWEAADVTPAKSDIVNDYAAVYAEDGNLILYFGQNRQLDNSGDANVGFWLLQNAIGLDPDGTFSGVHADGDLLVQSEFTNGGSVSGIRVYEWLNGGITEVTQNVGTCVGGKLAQLDACAIVNTTTIPTSWAGNLTAPFFFEGGVNLSALFPEVPCFSTFLTNTRTSQSTSADLKDFGLGSIDTCASLKITKQATPSDATQFGYSTTGGLSPATFTLASGQSRSYTKLQPGSYSVVEDVLPAGWALENLSCPVVTGPGTSAIVSGATASITLGFVGHVECTYTNARPPQVRVLKDLVPANDTGKFDLRINGTVHADDVSDGGDTGFKTVAPGQITVDELAGTATALGNYVSSVACDSGKGSSSGTSHAFSVANGDQVTCTITNTRKGKIVVEKQTLPNGDAQSFQFTASYDAGGFSLSDDQQNDSGLLAPGTYSVSETVPAGWDLKSAVCSDGSAVGAIALAPGEVVTCVFTNEKDARIVVEKQTLPNGDPQVFSFDASYDANGFDLTDGQQNDSGDLDPGTYSVSENVPAGWDLLSAVCSDQSAPGAISLQAGEVVTCVFTNEKDARIVVEKQTDPDGTAQPFTFTASYDADGFQLADGQQNDSGDLDPGTYSVSETVPVNWNLTSAVCSDGSAPGAISLQAGEVVTCVFTNTLERGRIIVEKQTLPNGDPQVFSFDASYDANGFDLTDGQQNTSGLLLPGTYSVSENVPAGWDLESAICSDGSPASAIALGEAEIVTCVFTNEKDASIVVEKQTLPNGDPQSFHFDAGYDADGFDLTDGQQNDSGDLDPGTYSVSENVPAGWDLESATCSDESAPGAISLQAGEVVTCVFTNEKDARIVVEKQTIPNDDPQEFAFDASYDADGFSLADGQQDDSGDLDPGTYSVSENVPAGWDLESATCSDESAPGAISLQAGEVVTCVFTNEKDARIVVEKQTIPNGDPQAFTFAASYDADGFSLSDDQQNDSGDLDPGTYSVSETVPALGWDLESATCSDQSAPSAISLQAGEVVTCVFTNRKRPPGSLNVVKTVTPTTLKEPGGTVSYTVTVENTSQVNVTVNSVVDDKFGNLANVAGGTPAGCFAVPFVLAPGASSTCTFPKTLTGAAGEAHVNVVTVTGTDTSGNTLTDSDDARVDFTPRLIDLVIVKNATSPTPLNETVTYTMTITNKGPDTATNVQVADPAPAGIRYLSVNPGAPTCTVTTSMLTCNLGTLEVGQSRTITLTARATTVGRHTNTATVTGSGGRETNPADNTDSAVTVVPTPFVPPAPKPKPSPCLTLTATPRMVTADGRVDTLKVRVTAGKKRMARIKVRAFGAGVKKSTRSKANGIATLRINPKRAGVITITARETKQQQVCGPKRIGAVGVFLPPLTG
jgi:uncharacterized repeat protein (TIGR01451 family)